MAAKGGKKGAGQQRVSSATPREAASVAASAGGLESKRPKITIWPEWNDADVNAEKWDAAHKAKDDKKGKSPTVQQHFFEDPDGRLDMPASLRVDHWKRPQDFIVDKTPVVVDTDYMAHDFDLISHNEHLHESELLRYIISQVTTLWELSLSKNPADTPDPALSPDDPLHTWRPWEHIYSLCKVAKHHVPLYNSHGKYVVRLYWMGCWRKILVDDLLPFDENDQLLLPATALSHELWPMLLTKALIKIASLDYSGGSPGMEFGDITIIHCLTGWLPEAIPLQYGHLNEVWELLKTVLPEWQLPEAESEKPADHAADPNRKEGSGSVTGEAGMHDKVEASPSKDVKPEKQEKGKEAAKDKPKEKEKGKEGKEGKDKKDKDKDKDKGKEKTIAEEQVIPDKPEVVVFAMFGNTAKYPMKVSVLGEMADASERLRQNGLSHIYPHPVCITQTRSCPLEPPPPPEVVPAWKLIRPRKKKVPPTDEPKVEPEPPKDIQCLEISSPFVNYKVSPVPIPTETYRPKSSLERGSTRSRPTTGNVGAIEETDENAPEPEIIQATSEPQEPDVLILLDEPPRQQVHDDGGLAGNKAEKAGVPPKKRSTSSAHKRSVLEGGEATEHRAGKTSSAKLERSKSGTRRLESRNSTSKDDVDTKKKDNRGDAKTPVSASESVMAHPHALPHPEPSAQCLHSGLSFPVDPVTGAPIAAKTGEDGVEPELLALHGEDSADAGKPKKVWMDFDQFCVCFRTLFIFHKPNTYLCNQRHSDLRNVSPSTAAPAKGDKKPAPAATGGGGSDSAPGAEDKSQYFLFVDNLNPTEIVIAFSVLPRWFDIPVVVEEKKLGKVKDKDSEKEPTVVSSNSMMDGSIGREQAPPPPVTPGTLVAEPHSWKSLVTGQPILRLRTTGTRAAVLSLPAGRHVLRFMMTSPLGYHVHMCSTVNFVFGDEETVMPQLTNESCRFRDSAAQVIISLGKCISAFSDAEQFDRMWLEFVKIHCPYLKNKMMSKRHHFQVFNDALYNMLRKALRDVASPEIAFAWRAFNFDVTYPNILSLPFGSRPETSGSESVTHTEPGKTTGSASARGSAKPSSKKREPEKVENPWAARYLEPTPEEHVAAVKIQKVWRGYWVRKVKQARSPGTEENQKAHEHLLKSWACIEPAAEENGLFLFREMFRHDSDLMQHYPFYKDEWNKISYADYRGIFPDHPSNTWFIVFRDIFFVKEETLVVPRMYVPIPTCMLRVIDNDTGQELPTVFQKVAPYIYKRNKKGYTFVAEARTIEQPLMSGAWRMRLIGSISPLPAPRSGEVNCNFITKEIRDYYVPNPKNIILRYTVKVTEEQITSLQICTSKPDVYVRLMVLDHEEEMASAVGKGHTVIPSFIFLKDPPQPGEESAVPPGPQESKRSNSRGSNRGGAAVAKMAAKAKRNESAKSHDGRASRSSQQSEPGVSDDLDEKDAKTHKYIVQAEVLHNSWPLSESSWAFVQLLKEQEKNELKVGYKERPASPAKNEKTAPAAGQKAKPKGSKVEKPGKDKGQEGKGSRPPSQQFDITKPSWTLRIVVDANTAEEIEVKKDTERADEIRAIKKAWEDAEPGRAAKALQSRLKYLSTHTVKLQPDEEEVEASTEQLDQEAAPPQTPLSLVDQSGLHALESEMNLTLEPPPGPTPREMLQPLDITPFVKKTLDQPRLLDEAEMRKMLEERQRQIAEYKAFREQVEAWRAQDRALRNATKIRQLDEAQALQTAVDMARESVNVPREAFRQRFLEAERRRQEDLAAQEAAMRAEQEAKSDKGRKSAKGKGSGKKKK